MKGINRIILFCTLLSALVSARDLMQPTVLTQYASPKLSAKELACYNMDAFCEKQKFEFGSGKHMICLPDPKRLGEIMPQFECEVDNKVNCDKQPDGFPDDLWNAMSTELKQTKPDIYFECYATINGVWKKGTKPRRKN